MPHRDDAIRDADYARLLAVRTGLRRFERWSAEQAADPRADREPASADARRARPRRSRWADNQRRPPSTC